VPEHPIAGVLGYLRELEPLEVGGALDCWQPQELVEVVMEVEMVVVVVAVDVVPPWKTGTRTGSSPPSSSTIPHVALDSTQTLTTKHPSRFLDPGKIAYNLGSSGFTTTLTYVDAGSRTIGSRTGNCECHHDQ